MYAFPKKSRAATNALRRRHAGARPIASLPGNAGNFRPGDGPGAKAQDHRALRHPLDGHRLRADAQPPRSATNNLFRIAHFFGIPYAPSALFLIAIFGLTLLVIQLFTWVSKLNDRRTAFSRSNSQFCAMNSTAKWPRTKARATPPPPPNNKPSRTKTTASPESRRSQIEHFVY